jgi:hypothetical protein
LSRRSANQLFLAAILTLYGVITLGGPALHALPGIGHGSAGLASEEGKLPARADQENAAAHDCPICHFHAQGQLVADPDAGPSADAVLMSPASETPLILASAAFLPSIPRAPPAA